MVNVVKNDMRQGFNQNSLHVKVLLVLYRACLK
jgi:hypothetical protein